MLTLAAKPLFAANNKVLAFVGAYTDRGKGIHIFEVESDGGLKPVDVLTGVASPSYLALSRNNKFLYAVSEGSGTGAVTALSVASDGSLKVINSCSSGGRGPAHLSLDPTGKFILVANYAGGSAAVVAINPDGSVDKPTDTYALPKGPYGKQPAADAPPGSFAISGHEAPHAHQAVTDPSGNHVYVCDLATDRVYIFNLDRSAGKLTPAAKPFVQASAGAGPRNLVFHPNGKWVYCLNEESSTLDFMTYDPSDGSLTIKKSITSLPAGFAGTSFAAEIHLSLDGRYVYAANRLCNTIGTFAIGKDGTLKESGQYWARGDYPRGLAIEPQGRFFFAAHSRSDNITSFRIDRRSGALKFTGKYIPVGNPSKMVFVTV